MLKINLHYSDSIQKWIESKNFVFTRALTCAIQAATADIVLFEIGKDHNLKSGNDSKNDKFEFVGTIFEFGLYVSIKVADHIDVVISHYKQYIKIDVYFFDKEGECFNHMFQTWHKDSGERVHVELKRYVLRGFKKEASPETFKRINDEFEKWKQKFKFPGLEDWENLLSKGFIKPKS